MIHLGSIRGTTIGVDFSFLFLLALFVSWQYDPNVGIQHALLWIPIVFISVLFHEFAHAAVIGLFGFGPSEIVLGGIGGATMNKRVAKPWQDVLISLAGPVASFGLAGLSLLAVGSLAVVHRDPMLRELVPALLFANVWWGEFNLLPIVPLDGGQATRNFLRIFLREKNAFRIAVWIAIVAGVLTVIWAIMHKSIMLAALIAWYVFMNYQQWQYYRDHGTPGE